MPFLLGENVNIGIGTEATRGTGVAPQAFIPGRTPSGVRPVLDKVLIKETRKSRSDSQDSETVMIRAEGDLEFNLRVNTLGWLLKSLLGTVVSAAVPSNSGVFEHDFNLDIDQPQNPTLTLALSQGGQQDFEYPNAVVSSLEIRTPVNDLVNATVGFIATKETAHADYSVAFVAADRYFRHYDITIKIADNVAGLAAAPALDLKEFVLSIVNNARVDQNIGELNPSDVLGMLLSVGGSMVIDHLDEVYHDIYIAGTYKAMSIKMVRNDITIGTNQKPTVEIIIPKVSFENLSPDRPIDDVVKDTIEFKAHYDLTLGYIITFTLINTIEDYDA